MEGDPSTLDITTLVIALIGLAAAFLSLGWQVASWLLSGPRVRVGVSYAIMTMSDGSIGPRCIAVEARNVGRAEASLVSWAIRLPNEGTIVPAMSLGTPWWGPSLPHPLAGGHSVAWLVDFDSFVDARAHAGFAEVDVRSVVSLGSGKKVVSRSTIRT